MTSKCKTILCNNTVADGVDFCQECVAESSIKSQITINVKNESLSSIYPQYYKSVGNLTEIDVYATHYLFNIQDPSGCIQHASKKLLLSGVRTGGKSMYKDIKEARDTLNRWLELYPNKE